MSSTSSKRTESFTARVLMAVAVFGLMLFAGACGDSANGDNNSPFPATSEYEGFCSEFRSCATQSFDAVYESVDECASQFETQTQFGLGAANNLGQSCRNALSSYYSCFFSSYQCSSGSWDQNEDCGSEGNAVQQECSGTQ